MGRDNDMRQLGLIVLLTIAAFATSTSLGHAATPETSTQAFVAMCDTPAASTKCILEFQVVDAANDWTDDPKLKNCAPISDFGDSTFAKERAQIRRVVAWLKQHPELMDQSDTSSVGAALRALYPCH